MNIMTRSALSILSAFVLSVSVQAAQLGAGAFSVGVAKGNVTYKVPNSETFVAAPSGTALPEGATLRTGDNSSVSIVFSTGSVATLGANSEVQISNFKQEAFTGTLSPGFEPSVSDTQLVVVEGEVISNVAKLRKGSKYEVTSPVGAAGVRGTIFAATYNTKTGEGRYEVAEGSIVLTLANGTTVTVGAGYGWSSVSGLYPLTAVRQSQIIALSGTDSNVSNLPAGSTTNPLPIPDLIGVSIN